MNEYYEYYGPTYRLDVLSSNADDMNTPEYLHKIKTQVFENLRHTGVPSVQQQPIPKTAHDEDDDIHEDERDPDDRKDSTALDKRIQRDDEFSDSEDEGEGGRRDHSSHKKLRKSKSPSAGSTSCTQLNGNTPATEAATPSAPAREPAGLPVTAADPATGLDNGGATINAAGEPVATVPVITSVQRSTTDDANAGMDIEEQVPAPPALHDAVPSHEATAVNVEMVDASTEDPNPAES